MRLFEISEVQITRINCMYNRMTNNTDPFRSLIWVSLLVWSLTIQSTLLTHCILNRLSHTIYWKSPLSILGTSGYEIYIFLEKMAKLFANNGDPDQTPHSAASDLVCLFVLRFYGPVNPMGSCRAWSVYLTTLLLGRLSPLSG